MNNFFADRIYEELLYISREYKGDYTKRMFHLYFWYKNEQHNLYINLGDIPIYYPTKQIGSTKLPIQNVILERI